ncbi:hypothetical protein [Parafrankia sp. EUN1f]|uniref:hypothetical protein n=1 Tax=Parafrankia sp. EUN1f TaxID=102897 RepID=UPI00056C8394|nr:hypothetical protein [Parafrankia sp. EUN1f]
MARVAGLPGAVAVEVTDVAVEEGLLDEDGIGDGGSSPELWALNQVSVGVDYLLVGDDVPGVGAVDSGACSFEDLAFCPGGRRLGGWFGW